MTHNDGVRAGVLLRQTSSNVQCRVSPKFGNESIVVLSIPNVNNANPNLERITTWTNRMTEH